MALVALLSFVRVIELMKYSYLFSFDILLHSDYPSTDFTLYLSRYNCVASLQEICIGVGLMFMQVIALCHPWGYRVVFNNCWYFLWSQIKSASARIYRCSTSPRSIPRVSNPRERV